MVASNIGTGLMTHQSNNIMQDKKPTKNGKRNGYWFVSYSENTFGTEYGWHGNYVNDELLGYFEDLGEYNVVINKEYYAR